MRRWHHEPEAAADVEADPVPELAPELVPEFLPEFVLDPPVPLPDEEELEEVAESFEPDEPDELAESALEPFASAGAAVPERESVL